MSIKAKKDFKSLIIYILTFLLFGVIFFLDVYVIYLGGSSINYILLYIILFFMLLNLIKIIYLLSSFFNPLTLKDNELIVKKNFKKITVKYGDIYALYSSSLEPSLSGDIYLYLTNYKIIKIKDIRFSFQIKEIILAKTNKEEILIAPEDKLMKFFNRFISFFTSIFLRFITKPSPVLSTYQEVVTKYKEKGIKKVFVLISKSCYANNLFKPFDVLFKENNIDFFIKDVSIKNPHEEIITSLKEEYLSSKSEAILGIGGGAILDASKALGILVNNKKELNSYKGVLKVKKNLPFLILAPTTSGSGSETTMYLVISNENSKYSISSPKVMAKYAFLNEDLISTLPLKTLESSSMDAITHALEGYLNYPRSKKIDLKVIKTISSIFSSLDELVKGNDTKEIRFNLLKASYEAGAIFNQKLVGNIHALSHALSMKYNLDHAKTNAIIMPEVLKTYLYNKKSLKRLSYLSYYLGLSVFKDDTNKNSEILIEKIESYNNFFGYKKNIEEILPEDLNLLSHHAYKEAHLLYPTPRQYSLKEFFYMYIHLKNIK